MSEDFEKPLTDADADAQPTKPKTEGQSADTVGDAGPDAAADAIDEDVGGVQGTLDEDNEGAGGDGQGPPIDAPARQPDVGGDEIEWTELGREPPVEREIDGDDA